MYSFWSQLLVRQQSTDAAISLHSGESRPFHWLDGSVRRLLQVSVGGRWSGGFEIDKLGEFAIKIPVDEGGLFEEDEVSPACFCH
jgi:hypothetical protein